MNSIPDRTTAIIFDLGGVIVDLAPERTLQAFAALAQKPVEQIVKIYIRHAAFYAYETGRIGDAEFRDSIREIFSINSSDEEIDSCWNAMLLGIPPGKLAMLTQLKNHFTTLALSNTNSIHLAFINNQILKGGDLNTYFHHVYYSHEIGMRKPEQDIYRYVLDAQTLTPEHTFFLDDNQDNINAANAVKIKTLLIDNPDRVTELFKNYA